MESDVESGRGRGRGRGERGRGRGRVGGTLALPVVGLATCGLRLRL